LDGRWIYALRHGWLRLDNTSKLRNQALISTHQHLPTLFWLSNAAATANMVVPFGFSVGDIIAGTSTLIQCFQAFQATGGAADKYEEAVTILNGMKITLQWTKDYTDQLFVENYADEIEVQVAHVEKAWKRMDKFLQKFDKVVPIASNTSKTALRQKFRNIFATVNWTIKDLAGEVVKLRDAVAQPLQILNHLLMLQMLYVLLLSFDRCRILLQQY